MTASRALPAALFSDRQPMFDPAAARDASDEWALGCESALPFLTGFLGVSQDPNEATSTASPTS